MSLRILVLTHLYPVSRSDISKTRAIHNFVKYWVNAEDTSVEVWITKQIITRRNVLSFYFEKDYVLDGVNIKNLKLFHYVRKGFISWKPVYRRLKKMRKKNKFNIIVAHSYISGYISYKISQRIKIPYVFTIHISDIINIHKSIPIMKHADGLAFRSHSIYKMSEDYMNLENYNKYIALSGIPRERVINDKELKNKLKNIINKNQYKLLFVGSLIPLKNVDIILQSIKTIDKDFQLIIAGEGPEKKKLQKYSHEANITNKVTFLGRVEHEYVFELMTESDIFIMPSAPETFGLVYLEAMARGMVVIGSKGWGIDGVIKDGCNGFLVEPRNVDELRIKIVRAMDRELLKIMIGKSISTVQNLNERKVAMNYLNYIKQIYSKKK